MTATMPAQLPPDGCVSPPTRPSGGSHEPLSAAQLRAQAHPGLRRLSGWQWEQWQVPGSASDDTLVGYWFTDGVLLALFIQTEQVATARWTVAEHPPRELGVAHGSVPELLARILGGRG